MSYTPTNWQTGDTVTAEKLNHMEQGIASPIVTITRHIVAQPWVTYREYYTKSDVDKLTDAVILIDAFDDPDDLSTYVVGSLTPYYFQEEGADLKDFNRLGEKSYNTGIRLNKSTNTLTVSTATFTYSAANDYYYHDVSTGGSN
jgi:hypothetical protein